MERTILVVEDNDANRSLVKDVLALGGYEILEARDGSEGVRLAREHLPDLILMDVQMPVMNGLTATKILKADPLTKAIKVISLSAYAADVAQEEFLKTGFDDYLSKPLNIHALADKVRQYVGGR
jgi:CheY-like chemotaxis protein